MKPTTLLAALAAAALAGAVHAGDAALGEKEFAKCRTCHGIVAPDGTEIQRANRAGPNLYGVIGRQAGTDPGFRYGASLVAAGERGLVWDEATLVAYLADPQTFLRTFLDDRRARSNMAFRLARGGADVAAYLAAVAPAAAN